MAINNNSFIIGANLFKERGLLDDNVSDDIIEASILIAQNIQLKQLIGSNLYDKIIKLIIDEELECNTNYYELVEGYIVDYIIYITMSEIQIPLAYKNKNIGTYTANDNEGKRTSTMPEINYVASYYRNKGESYGRQLVDYLCHNSKLFPEYNAKIEAGGNYPSKKPYSSKINIY